MKIKLEGQTYELNVEKAIKDGHLIRSLKDRLEAGDVFADPTGSRCNQMLVQVFYTNNQDTERCWNLLGLGCTPNSNTFYQSLHNLADIRKELVDNNYIFVKNIKQEVYNLVG